MTILGLIVEYNPFHNGHYYHLQKAKKITNAELIIAVMSGPFVQRGEPAIFDKWTRTRMALESGIDLVIELPVIYATQSANWFASGAIALLNHLKVSHLVFGSESNSIERLDQIANLLLNEPVSFQNTLKRYLSLGHSYPKAIALTLQEMQNGKEDFVLNPNDILGLQYLLQIKKHHSRMIALTIQRKSTQYHEQIFSNQTFASATAIRKAIQFNDEIERVIQYVPKVSQNLFYKSFVQRRFQYWENYYQTLKILILNQSIEQLKQIHGMVEGLESRLKESVNQAFSFEELISIVKTKRYTQAKLQRVFLHLLLNLTEDRVKAINVEKGPQYIRLLGFNQKGKSYLNQIKDELSIPLISKLSKIRSTMLDLDIQASQIYETGFKNPDYRLNEFQQKPIIL
ncbi:nucleotidyltransferase [Tepidibacillus fermentans]|uniref:tRNA(Met) cytidine acetate ligase n=1 Tax=Tepidibacillus fermentans TaxID=1281767 RepID=A0A4R3K8H9_9BACI|nr:nucleotidyltransferase [Tepidibacillus fermentans]TCS79230.1 putative nucleotidyltransferase [Tepidibacillus fermentans]